MRPKVQHNLDTVSNPIRFIHFFINYRSPTVCQVLCCHHTFLQSFCLRDQSIISSMTTMGNSELDSEPLKRQICSVKRFISHSSHPTLRAPMTTYGLSLKHCPGHCPRRDSTAVKEVGLGRRSRVCPARPAPFDQVCQVAHKRSLRAAVGQEEKTFSISYLIT